MPGALNFQLTGKGTVVKPGWERSKPRDKQCKDAKISHQKMRLKYFNLS